MSVASREDEVAFNRIYLLLVPQTPEISSIYSLGSRRQIISQDKKEAMIKKKKFKLKRQDKPRISENLASILIHVVLNSSISID